MMKMMKQAQKMKKMQKEIARTVVTEDSGGVVVAVTGDGKVKNLAITEELYQQGRVAVEKAVSKTVEKCLKKQQDVQKEKAKEAMGGMSGLSDLLG